MTVHGKCDYTVRRTLSAFEDDLDERLYRLGRSFIVNLTHITRTSVYIDDGSELILPRGHYEEINREFINLN